MGDEGRLPPTLRGRRGLVLSGDERSRVRLAGRAGAIGVPVDRHLEVTDAAPLERTDPRWVLAVRTAERLQGAILTLERREQLVRVGKVMGLSAFDANLVIAVVQDQARRGHGREALAGLAEPRLRMIGAGLSAEPQPLRRQRTLAIIAGAAALLALELFVVLWLMAG